MTASSAVHPSSGHPAQAATGLGWPLTSDPEVPPTAAGLGWPVDAPTPRPQERA